MPYEPLHHKYRPQTFKDLVGQETIALTLSNALKQEKIAPAYLFTGPRGTGKTSSARILAKSLNCLNSSQPTPDPCGKCEVCLAIANGSALDVMEIDAASNTGVDNIREIIERSRFAPVQCRYKIYAIDECHMLSTAAFNALLKTLEEPPPKVVFILATTDPQRVLPTIISRCQRFDYRRIPLPDTIAHLKYIAQSEDIAIATDAIALIAQIANGGLRDAESLLDQLSLLPEEISVAKVWDLVGAVPEQDLLKLLQAINQNNSIEILQQCRSLLDRGREPIVVLQNLASFYLNLLIAKTAPQYPEMVAVTETCWQQLCTKAKNWDTALILHGQQHLKVAENQLKQTTQPRLWLEVTLLGLLPDAQVNPVRQPIKTVERVADVTPANSTSPQTALNGAAKINSVKSPEKAIAPPPIEKAPLATSQATVKAPNNIAPVTPSPTQVLTTPELPPTQIESTNQDPQPAQPEMVSNSGVDSQEIWKQVISCLQPPITKSLLEQHCHLVSFDGLSAIVRISSLTLQKLHQGKVPNIEAAFASVYKRKVKVQLEAASPKNNSQPKNSSRNLPPPTSQRLLQPTTTEPALTVGQPQIISTPTEIPPEIKPEVFQPPVNPNPVKKTEFLTYEPKTQTISDPALTTPSAATNTQSVIKQPPPAFLTVKPEETEIRVASPPLSIEPDADKDYTDDFLQQAIANLTQSFEGELVEMDDTQSNILDIYEASETEELASITNSNRPNPEDYPDEW